MHECTAAALWELARCYHLSFAMLACLALLGPGETPLRHTPLCRICAPHLQAHYGGLYSSENVIITATHTHSAAGGFHTHFLYHITSFGFVKQSFDALVDGITEVS